MKSMKIEVFLKNILIEQLSYRVCLDIKREKNNWNEFS